MAASNKILPFMKGAHGRLIFSQDRVKKSFDFKSWSIKPVVVKHADGVNGEKRARLDKTLDYYEISASAYMKTAEALEAYLEAQAADDAGTLPLDQEGAVRFYPRDGTRESYILADLIWDDFDVNNGGRTENQMVSFSMRCTDVKKAKTI